MLGLVTCPNDICLSRANQSQAKLKSAVGRNLLQNWENLTIVVLGLYAKMEELEAQICWCTRQGLKVITLSVGRSHTLPEESW